MKLLNRSAIALKPTAVFVEWASRVNPDEVMSIEAFNHSLSMIKGIA
jgi:hypothetical protein